MEEIKNKNKNSRITTVLLSDNDRAYICEHFASLNRGINEIVRAFRGRVARICEYCGGTGSIDKIVTEITEREESHE